MALKDHIIAFYNNDTTQSQPYANIIGEIRGTYSPKGADVIGDVDRSLLTQEGLVVVSVVDFDSLSEIPKKNDVIHVKHKSGFIEGSFIIENIHRMRTSFGIVLGKMNIAGFSP